MAVLVIDIGTSGVRGAVVEADGSLRFEHYAETLPDSPADGLVEFDAEAYADNALACASASLADADAAGIEIASIGISNQRGSAIVWDTDGRPVAPAWGWQDLRTIGDCLVLAADGIRVAPNQAATKFAGLLNAADPDRTRDLRCGTPETWLAWCLSEGASFVTDPSNAGLTGLTTADAASWDAGRLDRLGIPVSALGSIVDSSGDLGVATALGRPIPIRGMAGDQQASLIGQGCVTPGMAKVTFGTGGMLNLCVGPERPVADLRAGNGTFPLVAWRRTRSDGSTEQMWAMEGLMLAAGTNVQWLRDDLGIIDSAAHSAEVAARCEDTGGVYYVPAQLGLGTPHWDYGARATFVGLTRGTGRPEIVRAVLEGVAHRGADLLDAAEADSGLRIEVLRIDGGMSENPVFCQAVADATQRRVEVAPVKDATALGAAYLAGLASDIWSDWTEVASLWRPSRTYEPGRPLDRERWAKAVERALGWHPDLSAIDF